MSSTHRHIVGRRTLYDLVRSNRWEEALARMRTEECGEDLRREDNVYSRLLLHWACSKGAPLECVEAMVEGHKEAVTVTDDDGNLPLHGVCQHREVSPRVVRLLLAAYPEGATVTNKLGELPLHRATHKGSPLEVSRMLLDAHPGGVTTSDSSGRLPLHRLVGSRKYYEYHDRDLDVEKVEVLLRPLLDDEEACLAQAAPSGATPLHVAARFNILGLHEYLALPRCPPDVIVTVVKRHPGQLQECDDDGNLPLHVAASNRNLNGAKVKGMVIPKLGYKDLVGELAEFFPPFTLAELLAHATNRSQNGAKGDEKDRVGDLAKLLQNLKLARGIDPSQNGAKDDEKDLIGELVKLYPKAVTTSNGEGRFPLFLAIESGKKWEQGVEAFVHTAEPMITFRDGATGLYAFMLAATVDDPCIDTVYSLLRLCPELERYVLD